MNSRRRFLWHLCAGTPLLLAARAGAQAQPGGPVKEDEPLALATGYVKDAKRVDAAKYRQFKKGQICENCALYTAPAGKSEGPCTIFQNRPVAAKGWCSTYAPKPKG